MSMVPSIQRFIAYNMNGASITTGTAMAAEQHSCIKLLRGTEAANDIRANNGAATRTIARWDNEGRLRLSDSGGTRASAAELMAREIVHAQCH